MGEKMRKGLFWLIDESVDPQLCTNQLLFFAAECDKNGSVLNNQKPYNSRKGDSYAHKQSWEAATKDSSRRIRNKPWDFFPRGRVEISNGKATVYHNPMLAEWSEFEYAVIRGFELEGFSVEFKPDYSKHYQSSD